MQISDVAFLPMLLKNIKLVLISLWPARLCAFWVEEVGQVLTAAMCMYNTHLQTHNEKYQEVEYLQLLLSSCALRTGIVHCTSKDFVTSPVHVVKNFLFVLLACPWSWSPMLLVQGRQGQIFSYSDRNCLYRLQKCENLFFICNWNRYFRNVLKWKGFFFKGRF